MSFWKSLRVLALLSVLAIIAIGQWQDRRRAADWERTLWVTVFPIVADAVNGPLAYVESLDASDFDNLGAFLAREGRRYGLDLRRPVQVQVAPPGDRPPPRIPEDGAFLATAWWSLKMRWYALRQGSGDGLAGADVKLFVIYHVPNGGTLLDRSVGVRNAMYGVVHAFGSRAYAGSNAVVIAHELLHVLGASDKYDPSTGLPSVPQGLADPSRRPLYPQPAAEIMAGRVALSPTTARIPGALEQCVIGPATAIEIGWR